jgi:hypothetical protein
MTLPRDVLAAAHRMAEQAPPLDARQRATLAALLAPALEQLRGRQGAA